MAQFRRSCARFPETTIHDHRRQFTRVHISRTRTDRILHEKQLTRILLRAPSFKEEKNLFRIIRMSYK